MALRVSLEIVHRAVACRVGLFILIMATAVFSAACIRAVSQAPAQPSQTGVQQGSASPAKPQKRPGPPCTSAEEAAKSPNREGCVTAHIYDVVELSDGTRFLDVCPPETPDEECRFTLLSPAEDRADVGELRRYRDQDVSVRGVVRVTHGRMGIVISHMRQFTGGPEKFRPNPKLLRDFNGQSERMPVRDPNLASGGRHRSFMNTRDKEDTAAPKH